MRIVGCYLIYQNNFLLLHRHAHKPDGDTWGLPSGKIEQGESDSEAMLRELYEETGYQASPDELVYIGEYDFTSTAGIDYTYVTYEVTLDSPHEVILESHAHSEYKWSTFYDASKQKDLINGLATLFELTGKI